MTTSLTVTAKGQVTLRKELLAHLGVRPGQRLDVEVLPGGLLQFQAQQATGTISRCFGLLEGRSERRAWRVVTQGWRVRGSDPARRKLRPQHPNRRSPGRRCRCWCSER